MPEALRVLAPPIVVIVLLFGILWFAFGELLEHRHNPNKGVVTGVDGPQRVVLKANPMGHFVVPGTINGHEVTFLVDTGASYVAVPAGMADKMGLERGPRTRVGTASGTASAYYTRLGQITVGGIRLRDIRGSIIPSMGGDAVLLGMNFLRHIDFRQKGKRLILEAGSP